mgnify:CR=1 FL=1
MEKRGMMKRFLAESLKELMLQKSFEKITIKQICDKTGVIRALSYIIYLDTVETALPYIEKRQFLQAVKAMLDNFVENREFYQIAFRITGQNSFEDLFEENIQQLFAEMFRRYGRPEKLGTMSEEELAGYFGNSLCYTVNHWLCRNRGMDSETFLKQYGFVVTSSIFDFLDMSQADGKGF